jgi:hypothetical protein
VQATRPVHGLPSVGAETYTREDERWESRSRYPEEASVGLYRYFWSVLTAVSFIGWLLIFFFILFISPVE